MQDHIADEEQPDAVLRQCARCRRFFPGPSREPGPTSTTWTCEPCAVELSASNLDGHP